MKEDRSLTLRGLAKPSEYVWRLATATVKAHAAGVSVYRMLEELYPDDAVTPILARGATTQATTTDPNWAGPLARTAVSDAVEDVVSLSAASRLEAAGALRVDMGRLASVVVPGGAVNAAMAGAWVAEGANIPVKQLVVSGATLKLSKLACLVVLTREILEASNIEAVLRKLLASAAGMALDAAMFSTSAGTAAQPAGLLYGLTPVTPASGGSGTPFEYCAEDLGSLVSDIATRGGGKNPFFITSPAEAVTIRFFAGLGFERSVPVEAAAGLPAKTAISLEPTSLAFSINDPEFTVSDVAAVHLEDTTPVGMGSPTKSMFQIDGLALKMVLRAAWGMRAPHIAYMTGVSW